MSFQSREKTPAHARPKNSVDALEEHEAFQQEAGNAEEAKKAGGDGKGQEASSGDGAPPDAEKVIASLGPDESGEEEEESAPQSAGPFEEPTLNEALSECFGADLGGLDVSWAADAENEEIGAVASTEGASMSFGSEVGQDIGDASAMEVIAHETAHALAGGGSGQTALDEAGDPGEASADKAGQQFAAYAKKGFEGPAPTLAPAKGGRASTHRKKKRSTPRVYAIGSSGGQVVQIQQRLRAHGHRVTVDGDFGPATQAAVISFQKKKGLSADGVVGPQTQAALRKGAGRPNKPGRPAAAKPNKPGKPGKPGKPNGSTTKHIKVNGSPPFGPGSRGERVRTLQRRLHLKVNGLFGPKTEAKVRLFQRRMNLVADGVVGAQTAAVLNGAKPPAKLRWMKGNGGRWLGMVRRQGEYMLPRCASAFDRMNAAARRHGVNLTIVDGFRSYREQVILANRLGIYGQGGLAAVPGTSNHGLGIALDLYDGKNYDWLNRNAKFHGFRRTVPGEPWHWEV